MRIHDRYVLGGFWRNVAIGLIAFTVIFITVDINEHVDDYIDKHARLAHIALYYAFRIPWIVVLIIPVSVLLATVFSLGKLSRQNELTAFISSGTSLARVAVPIIVSSLFVSFGVMAFGEFVIPETNRASIETMRVKIEGKKQQETSRYRDNVRFQGEAGRTYFAERYDIELKALTNVIVNEYRGGTISRRIDARKALWDGGRWVFLDGAVREFAGEGEKLTPFAKLPLDALAERPEDFAEATIAPDEMNYRQLSAYIAKMARGGGPVDKYRVDLYVKLSYPFTNLIFAVLGVALASAKRKPSMATGFGVTLLASFTYYGILRIGQALGHSGIIPPLFGAWMGNIIFLVIGGILLHRANQ